MSNRADYDLPIAWRRIMVASLWIGALILLANPSLAEWPEGISAILTPEEWVALIGIMLIAVPITHWIIYYSMKKIDKLFDIEHESKRPDLWPPTLVGVAESILYPAAFATDNAPFIGVWLVVKVAGQWVRWGAEFPSNPTHNARLQRDLIEDAKKGRRRFNKFLIGNAMRIILGATTYLVLKATVLPQPTLDQLCCMP